MTLTLCASNEEPCPYCGGTGDGGEGEDCEVCHGAGCIEIEDFEDDDFGGFDDFYAEDEE